MLAHLLSLHRARPLVGFGKLGRRAYSNEDVVGLMKQEVVGLVVSGHIEVLHQGSHERPAVAFMDQ